jgi:transposase
MRHYVGLDVSLDTVSVCIVDEIGKVVREQELSSTPEAIGGFLLGAGLEIAKIGLESGNLTHYLTKGLLSMKYEVVVMDSRKMAAILAVTINKTDKNDARGIAEALRVGHYKQCIHRSDDSLEIRTLLHGRGTLVDERTHLVSSIKGHLKVYGIKLGKGKGKTFKEKVEISISALKMSVQKTIQALLNVLDVLEVEINKLDKEVVRLGKHDADVLLLQSIDGVGPVTALAFKAEMDNPARFKDSRDAGAYVGLTPTQYSSGETQRQGGISKRGSRRTRCLLVEAATSLLMRSKKWSKLKAWGMKLVKKKGAKKAIVAVARKMAVMMHRMLITKKPFERTGNPQEKMAA